MTATSLSTRWRESSITRRSSRTTTETMGRLSAPDWRCSRTSPITVRVGFESVRSSATSSAGWGPTSRSVSGLLASVAGTGLAMGTCGCETAFAGVASPPATAPAKASRSKGLLRKLTAPSRIAVTAWSSDASSVVTTMGSTMPASRMACISASPPSPRMSRSMTARSTCPRPSVLRAACPSSACRTLYFAFCRIERM